MNAAQYVSVETKEDQDFSTGVLYILGYMLLFYKKPIDKKPIIFRVKKLKYSY